MKHFILKFEWKWSKVKTVVARRNPIESNLFCVCFSFLVALYLYAFIFFRSCHIRTLWIQKQHHGKFERRNVSLIVTWIQTRCQRCHRESSECWDQILTFYINFLIIVSWYWLYSGSWIWPKKVYLNVHIFNFDF